MGQLPDPAPCCAELRASAASTYASHDGRRDDVTGDAEKKRLTSLSALSAIAARYESAKNDILLRIFSLLVVARLARREGSRKEAIIRC